MAKTKHALFSATAKGKIGDLVIENNKNTQYIRTKIKPKDKKSEKQIEKRKRYGEAVQAWKELTPEEQALFNTRAIPLRISGFNLFLKSFTTFPKIAIYGVGVYGVNAYGK